MEPQTKYGALELGTESLVELVDRIESHPFAQKNSFSLLSLQEIDQILEQKKQFYGSADQDQLTPEIEKSQTEFQEVCDLLCELFLLMENENIETENILGLQDLKKNLLRSQKILESELPVQLAVDNETSERTLSNIPLELRPKLPPKLVNLPTPPPIPNASQTEAPSAPRKSVDLLSIKAREFYALAKSLSTESSPAKVAKNIREEIELLSYYLALQNEIRERMAAAFQIFFPEREQVSQVVVEVKQAHSFNPQIKLCLAAIAETHSELLPDGKLPLYGLGLALIHLKKIDDLAHFKPTLIEAAALLLFFGHHSKFAHYTFHNSIGLKGIGNQETIELALRLVRIHSTFASSENLTFELKEEQNAQILEDLESLLKLVSSLEIDTETEAIELI